MSVNVPSDRIRVSPVHKIGFSVPSGGGFGYSQGSTGTIWMFHHYNAIGVKAGFWWTSVAAGASAFSGIIDSTQSMYDYIEDEGCTILTFAGILDDLAVAPVAAWELSRLAVDYTGPLLRLREDNNNDEDDFYDNVNTGTHRTIGGQSVADWLTTKGATNAYVTTLYDQVGSNDLTQTTAANQPLYNATGFNGLPSADFNGSSHYLTADGVASVFSGTDQPLSFMFGFKSDAGAGNRRNWSAGSSSDNDPVVFFEYLSGQFRYFRRDDTAAVTEVDAFTAQVTPQIQSAIFHGTTLDAWQGTTKELDGVTHDTGAVTVNRFTVGALRRAVVETYADCQFSGGFLFNSALVTAVESGLRTDYISLKNL